MTPAERHRSKLRAHLDAALRFSPGLTAPEISILLHAPFVEPDLYSLIPRSPTDISIYVRALLAQGLLSAPNTKGDAYRLTAKGEELFRPGSEKI